ncbi:MAG: alpha-L-fucosidase [Opitutales bacterium]
MMRKNPRLFPSAVLVWALCGWALNHLNADVPYYLKGHSAEALFAEAPRKANLMWYDDTRLGMFIHWGVWGKWENEWAMNRKRIPLDTYQAHARTVTGENFDAKAIATLAKASGMRYITFVAQHHDGFALWDSEATDFDSMDYPMQRDFVRELAEACREENIALFLYYSIGISWTHPYFIPRDLYTHGRPNYKKKPDHFLYEKPEDFEKFREYAKAQITELATEYGPIAGFWFDTLGGVLANLELFKMQEFYDLIHEHQPHALILFKTGATGTEDVLVGERRLSSIAKYYRGKGEQGNKIADLASIAWNANRLKKAEIAVTSQGGWAWSAKRKSRNHTKLYGMLEQAAKNNANLLLNFGPDPSGAIPPDVDREFRALGKMIQEQGYPPLNKETWKELRKQETVFDDNEVYDTAR